MTGGGQCVMTTGTALMLLWSASSWDIHTLEVSVTFNFCREYKPVYISSSSACAYVGRW